MPKVLSQAQVDYQAWALDYLNAVAAMQDAAAQLEDAIQQPLPPEAPPPILRISITQISTITTSGNKN